ncbi:MAG: ATP-binding protein [Planctomycetota bacterium]
MGQLRDEARRVLLPFSLAIAPPLILLTILAVVAARNDEDALRYVEEERTRQGAQQARAALHRAVRLAEEAVFATLLSPNERPDYAAAQRAHPLARRFLAVELEGGRRLWPRAQLPFRDAGDARGGQRQGDESSAASAALLQRRAELLDGYERARAQLQAQDLASAVAGFGEVVDSDEAPSTLRARAAWRLGACLEQLGQPNQARQAYASAAEVALPVRDEQGQPVRVSAALRVAELLRAAGDAGPALEAARALAEALLAGARHDDVGRDEWTQALERARTLLRELGQAELDAALATRQEEVLSRLRWSEALDELIPSLLEQARLRGTGEVRHYARLGVPPRVLAYRVEQESSGGVVVGFELDLERLARDVLAPACANIHLEEDVAVAVVDGRGEVLAYAGGAVRPDAEGRLRASAAAALEASVDLEDVPLWAIQLRRDDVQLHEARRNRLILYVSLLGLTLAAAATGAAATLRALGRSLELARMKSDFLSNMTHELKTPLTSVKMYGELLAMGRLKSATKRKEYAEHIVREADRLQRLIDDVLDFARQESGQHDYVLAEEDVADTVAEAIELFRLSAKVRGFDLFVELPPVRALPPVDLDRDAIVRAVLNLLSNAVKYSTDQRYIKVTVKRADRDQVAISVKDRGIGIDPEDLERIFDRFYRAGDELTRGISGAGLGLALIDQIVRAHGGEILVESEKGSGSTFTILLPIVEDYREQWPPDDLEESEEELEPVTSSDTGRRPRPPSYSDLDRIPDSEPGEVSEEVAALPARADSEASGSAAGAAGAAGALDISAEIAESAEIARCERRGDCVAKSDEDGTGTGTGTNSGSDSDSVSDPAPHSG